MIYILRKWLAVQFQITLYPPLAQMQKSNNSLNSYMLKVIGQEKALPKANGYGFF